MLEFAYCMLEIALGKRGGEGEGKGETAGRDFLSTAFNGCVPEVVVVVAALRLEFSIGFVVLASGTSRSTSSGRLSSRSLFRLS